MINHNPKFVFFGTPEYSVLVLSELFKSGLVPSLVITTIDKPQGRHFTMTPPDTKVWALAHNIPVMQAEKLTLDFQKELETFLYENPVDIFVVVAYGKIIPQRILDLSPKGVINVHPSLLPAYRGPTPSIDPILNGDTETAVSIMLIDKDVDHGPILLQEKYTIPEGTTGAGLGRILFTRGGELLAETMQKYLNGEIIPEEQDHALATFTKKISKEDGLIDLTDDQLKNYRKIKAYAEWPQTYFFTKKNDKRIRVVIKDAELENDTLIIKRVIPESKKEMNYEDFLRNV